MSEMEARAAFPNKTRKYETKQCKFKDLKRLTRLQIIYITNDFCWLKDV